MKRNICLAIACWIVVSSAWAGLVVTVESKDPGGGESASQTGRISIDGSKMTVSMENRGDVPEMIFRGDREVLWAVDASKREYIEIRKEMMANIGDQMGPAMKMMEQQLANLPPDQRAMVEKTMKERMPAMAPASPAQPDVSVKKTGEKNEVAGYPCVKYEIHRGGERVSEVWVTDWSNVEQGREAFQIFVELEEFSEELVKTMKDSPFGNLVDNPFDHFSKMDGLPVLTREFTDGRATRESLFKSIEQQDLPAALFEPPDGYKKVDPLAGAPR